METKKLNQGGGQTQNLLRISDRLLLNCFPTMQN
ncbi:hypothetical protein GYH30_003422 [Glycine max]|nr:hypothetical protein GYH30_003422 [Glycine max]